MCWESSFLWLSTSCSSFASLLNSHKPLAKGPSCFWRQDSFHVQPFTEWTIWKVPGAMALAFPERLYPVSSETIFWAGSQGSGHHKSPEKRVRMNGFHVLYYSAVGVWLWLQQSRIIDMYHVCPHAMQFFEWEGYYWMVMRIHFRFHFQSMLISNSGS